MGSFLIFAVLLRETHRKIVISGERESNGPVVQLVRMPPCHGGGRGFESRPVRKKSVSNCIKTCKHQCLHVFFCSSMCQNVSICTHFW